jgi:hypothetical protein
MGSHLFDAANEILDGRSTDRLASFHFHPRIRTDTERVHDTLLRLNRQKRLHGGNEPAVYDDPIHPIFDLLL